MDLVPLLTYGYRPRFGDSRDAGRTARCHSGLDAFLEFWVGCQVKLFEVSNLQAWETDFQAFRAFEISQPGHSSRYHETDEVVIVQWRRKLSQETLQTSLLNVPFPFNVSMISLNPPVLERADLQTQSPTHARTY